MLKGVKREEDFVGWDGEMTISMVSSGGRGNGEEGRIAAAYIDQK